LTTGSSLYRNRQLVREGYCSSGSYTLLKTEEGDKEWIFKTPRGRLSIQGKITNPVWRKPDWAFVEEGLPIPGPTDPSRYEFGVLGKYAMSLGDGYLIHGTLYQRQLGMPVTHGCIRLGDEDLEAVFSSSALDPSLYLLTRPAEAMNRERKIWLIIAASLLAIFHHLLSGDVGFGCQPYGERF
jgi:hypothetical protein